MPKVLVINGPNLNMLGTREPEIYGSEKLEDINASLKNYASELGVQIDFMQSNHEGEIVDAIQNAKESADAVLINPGAFTHTSIAIRDAFLATAIPFVEVHLSNIHAREHFRKKSLLSDIAQGIVMGFGPKSYSLGLDAIASILNNDNKQ